MQFHRWTLRLTPTLTPTCAQPTAPATVLLQLAGEISPRLNLMNLEELLFSTLLLFIMETIVITTPGTTKEPGTTITVLVTTLEPGERLILTCMETLG